MTIPKRIIQTGPSDLPLFLRSAIQTVKLLHPEFEYLFFDDEQVERFIGDNFPEYLEVFHSFRFRIQKYDFFRYLAVYHLGGFYLDLDVFLATDLTPLLRSSCVFPFEELTPSKYLWKQFRMDWHVGNYAFGAVAGHPFLQAIVTNCVRASRDPSWVTPMLSGIPRLFREQFYVLNTTGPGLVSRTFAENPEMVENINVLFPSDVRDRDAWHQFGCFGVHRMDGSWRARRNLLWERLFRVWDSWTLHRVLTKARSRGKVRTRKSYAANLSDSMP
jgi:inositol phosphorylceramide mannosyltransferase catalytic subunit